MQSLCSKYSPEVWGTIIKLACILLGLCFFVVYVACMVVIPFVQGGWHYMLSVWYEWQPFNAAMLALLSSIIALYATRYQALEQRSPLHGSM